VIGYYSMSIIGDAHLKKGGSVCQDASGAVALPGGWVAAAVADGLGSAKYSDIGARTAVASVLEFIWENKPDRWHAESLKALMLTAFHGALKAVRARSVIDENEFKDYDTTLDCVIYNGSDAVWGHSGDGGIIALTPFGEFKKLTDAQKGEAHNEVVPLRGGPGAWVFGNSEESICALLMMTDGVYDFACPWLIADKAMPINLRFVRWMMDTNLQPLKSKEDFVELEGEIRKFLTNGEYPSKSIADDKTVAGIINTGVVPETMPEEYYREPDWKKLRDEKNAVLYRTEKPLAELEGKPAVILPPPSSSLSSPPHGTQITGRLLSEPRVKTEKIEPSMEVEKRFEHRSKKNISRQIMVVILAVLIMLCGATVFTVKRVHVKYPPDERPDIISIDIAPAGETPVSEDITVGPPSEDAPASKDEVPFRDNVVLPNSSREAFRG
jgi:hypothetical protein